MISNVLLMASEDPSPIIEDEETNKVGESPTISSFKGRGPEYEMTVPSFWKLEANQKEYSGDSIVSGQSSTTKSYFSSSTISSSGMSLNSSPASGTCFMLLSPTNVLYGGRTDLTKRKSTEVPQESKASSTPAATVTHKEDNNPATVAVSDTVRQQGRRHRRRRRRRWFPSFALFRQILSHRRPPRRAVW